MFLYLEGRRECDIDHSYEKENVQINNVSQ